MANPSIFIFLIWIPLLCRGSQEVNKIRYQASTSSRLAPRRLVLVMQQYTQEAAQRVHEAQEMRMMYEESPHYEYGYLMAEIVERYRRIVNHAKRPMMFQSDGVFATLKRTEVIQHLYFEVYHLVNMMHEIERKYSYLPEFHNLFDEIDLLKVREEQDRMKVQDRLESRDRKKRNKFYKKLEQLSDIMAQKRDKETHKKQKIWPMDYGWEIDYWW